MVSVELPEAVWTYLRWNAYLSHTHKLFYVSTPKVACTSLKWWLAELEGYAQALSEFKDSNESDPDLIIHDSFHKVAPQIAGLGPEALAPALVSEEYFRFAVVRNPYKRIFSAWQSKLLLREPLQSQHYLDNEFFNHPITSLADIRASFEGFLEHLASKEAPNFLDLHWTPQADLLRPDLIAYTKLSQIEDVRELDAALSRHLGPHVANPFTSRRANESLIPYSENLVTPRAAELIQLLYRRDFDLFGYESHLPEAKKELSDSELDVSLHAIRLIRARHQALINTRLSFNGKIHTLNENIHTLNGNISNLHGNINNLHGNIRSLHGTINEVTGQVNTLNHTVSRLNQSISKRDQQIAALQRNLKSVSAALDAIRRSTAWSVALRITRVGAILFPSGTRRGRAAQLSIRGLRTWRREGVLAALRKTKNHFLPSEPDSIDIEPILISEEDPYVPIRESDVDPANVMVKPIAFYLPQFHPIPENDAWWGKGFTEWTNVTKAHPNFEGHYQPHVPEESLGYYDLRSPEVQKRQVELAKKYGVYGFCFYYYWFAGKRLLERPLDQYLADPALDLPFCLCWANENWTRRWDGAEHEILIGQNHNEQEYLHFIQDISPNFKDPRYIRVDGKPMLLVYRINLLPDPQVAARIWRDECRRLGIGEIYLAAVQSFGIIDPHPYGFDAAVEFPPSHLGAAEVSQKSLKMTNQKFNGRILDYHSAASMMTQRRPEGYTLFKSVMLSWDNTARRQNESHIFVNATPSAYQNWLENVVTYTRKVLPEDKRFVFINAWNEWAEGTHLEPDRRYGYAYLQATADAIQGVHKRFPFPKGWKILFVAHDAHKGGAQAALLSTLGWFKEHTSVSITVLCLEGGALLPRFEALADTILLSELGEPLDGNTEQLTARLLDFCRGKPDLIYGNTVVAGKAYPWLRLLGVPILTHAYELEMSIQRYAADWIGNVLEYSTHYITPSNAVKDNLVSRHAVNPDKITVVYGAVSNEPIHLYESAEEKKQAREKLGLDVEKFLVVGCGLGMPFRKGADLFIKLGEVLRQQGQTDFHLYWIGGFEDSESDPAYGHWADHRAKLSKNNLDGFVTFLGYKENFKDYFLAADLFVLPSREDPLPLVAIEAAKCGLPIICFAEAGGTPDLVGDDAGFVVPFEDVEAMAAKVLQLMDDPSLRRETGRRAREKFLSQFTVERTTPAILSTCRRVAGRRPAVSVIVPNYNHAHYLPKRLESIFNQTFQDFEVILLDDASTDDSLEVLQQYASYGDVRIHQNDQNSGSPFKQWIRGLELARAEVLWVAESDDVCNPQFLEELLPAFQDPAIKLAYANSNVIDESGRVIGDYSSETAKYLAMLSSTKWRKDYIATAEQEINDGLGVKNTILNASAVLFRKFEMPSDLKETLGQMRIAGDWYFYVHAIKNGKIYYDCRKWNGHRRHSNSVIAQTISDLKIRDLFREFALVHTYIFNTYRLDAGFREKWETYLLQQLRDFSLESSYSLLRQYYPFDEMRALLADTQQHQAPREMAGA